MRVVVAAAKLIRAQILASKYSTDQYPFNEQFDDVDRARQWMPELLNAFLGIIIRQPKKLAAIGHSIVQTATPRTVIAPILFGLGVSLDHVFGSEWLLTTLSRLGFSLSCDEITRYNQSVVESSEDTLPHSYPAAFTQWASDNVDHNISSLNGHASFHGMGIVSMSVSRNPLPTGQFGVMRCNRKSVDNVCAQKGISLLSYYASSTSSLSPLFSSAEADSYLAFMNVFVARS